MADRISTEQRSRNMAAVRSRGNITTELALVKIFRKTKITGWRRHQKIFGIRPDFVFSKQRIAVFVHGCFWHGCRWHGEIPVSNRKFWREKINMNKNRDRIVNRELKHTGWKVLRFWEHELKKKPKAITTKIKKVFV